MMDPIIGSLALSGFIFSSCFRLRTSHQSTIKITKAISFTDAHSPTYLKKIEIDVNKTYISIYFMIYSYLYRNFSMS